MIPTCPKCGRWEFIPAPPGADFDMPYPGPTFRSFRGPCAECLELERRTADEKWLREEFERIRRDIENAIPAGR